MNEPLPDGQVTPDAARRLRVSLCGAVQGVGFRPFVYRLATEMGLRGWVQNGAQGVAIEVEGGGDALVTFLARLDCDKPPRAVITHLESAWLEPVGYAAFEIRASDGTGTKTAVILPDLATCADCRREIFDPSNRRFRYPFTNCTNCGPRWSILRALPYDRPNTTMRDFPMCPACRAEYENPLDRRFHAQPTACPACGPQLALWDARGEVLAERDDALRQAANALRQGQIVALKGLGGFQLLVDARDAQAVLRLRQRKQRAEKPFALMYPSLERVRAHCELSELETRLLLSPSAPIVLVHRIADRSREIAPAVAPGNPYLGVMLPYTPLHHLLCAELGFPIVATSGNRSEEPICIDQDEALERLAGIADLFLIHNRPIARQVDDSVARVMLGREQVLRCARGYAPLPLSQKESLPPTLAVGAHLKNTIALSVGARVFLSQHIGDLETAPAYAAFQRVIRDFEQLYENEPAVVACDAHPDYLSTRYALQSNLPVTRVQHHFAHVAACMAENAMDGAVLGVAWDGTGYGLDGTIWGGEFLRVAEGTFTRTAHLRAFRLPGGDKAIREPKRAALGLLYELYGGAAFDLSDLAPLRACSPQELTVLKTMLSRPFNAPLTTSAGRLFDAVAALAGLRQSASFEGQAAMEFEFALDGFETEEMYPFTLREGDGAWIVDWGPMVEAILAETRQGARVGEIAARFHNTLVEMIVRAALRAGEPRVVLTGGCFQNKYLTERAVHRLTAAGLRPFWHQRVPPNDGGIAVGQILAAAWQKECGNVSRNSGKNS